LKPLPPTDELLEVARRVVWFAPPAEALLRPTHLLAHALTYGMPADMAVLRRYVPDDELRAALDEVPPGIMDARSWAYWNLRVGRYPPRRAPTRSLGAAGRG
jgi:hypothetical protein